MSTALSSKAFAVRGAADVVARASLADDGRELITPARQPALSALEAELVNNRALLTVLLTDMRRAKLAEVDAIERALGISPRTSELRRGI